MKATAENADAFDGLRRLLVRLRGPEGCPWDRKQTPQSLKIYLLEECYELTEALDRQAPPEIREELGDLLFILLFINQVYEEQGLFNLRQVLETITQKMIRRHPHVFGEADWQDPGEVVKGWQTIKDEENPKKNPLDSIPAALPGLLKAHRLSQRAAGWGFEWPQVRDVFQKIREELAELETALDQGEPAAVEEELGDVLFTLVNLGRVSGCPAENALAKTNQKFSRRFQAMLQDETLGDRDPRTLTPEEWQSLWRRAKT